MWTAEFWKAVAERGVKSFAQGAAAVWGLAVFTDLLSVANQWEAVLVGGISMSVLSVLTSVGSAALTSGGPSITNAEVLPTRV